MRPQKSTAGLDLVLPGNVQAFLDTPIYARTNGYLKKWYADIGAHVKNGQLLAEIDTPEVDDQLRAARADLANANANYALAKSTADRWTDMLKSKSVSKQETDEKVGDMLAKKATLDAARFNVARLEKTQSFQKVYAPFDGIVTARNVDVGALIDAGSSGGPAKELFHVAQADQIARLCERAAGVCAAGPRATDGVSDADRDAVETLSGHRGAHLGRRRSATAHHAGRSRCRQSQWRSAAGRIRAGAFRVGRGRGAVHAAGQRAAVSPGRRESGHRRCAAQGEAAAGFARNGLRHARGNRVRLARRRAGDSESAGFDRRWRAGADRAGKGGGCGQRGGAPVRERAGASAQRPQVRPSRMSPACNQRGCPCERASITSPCAPPFAHGALLP